MTKSEWTTTKLTTAASLAVLYVLVSIPGYSLTLVSGIPGLSGIVNTFIQAIIVVLVYSILKTRGSVLLVSTLYGILTLPLPSLGGAGFLPKVLISFLAGLLVELVLMLPIKSEKIRAVLAANIFPIGTGFLLLFIGSVAGVDLNKLVKLSILFVPSSVIFGLLGLFGLQIYKKIENTTVVKRIQKE